jgi:hypothetical protein
MKTNLKSLASLFIFSLVLCGCRTIDYRSIQSEFEVAAQGDNYTSATTFTESSVFTDPGYEAVLKKLNADYIERLDEKLRPNAWMLKAISEWRVGKLEEAHVSATQGLAAHPIEYSRDKIILTLLPALLIDSEIYKNWLNSGKSFSSEEYAAAKRDFVLALNFIADAESEFGPATPESAKYYCYYQEWRLIQNWWQVIIRQPSDTQSQLRDEAKTHLSGKTPVDAAKEAKDKIPSNHQLRLLIEAIGG